MAEDEFVSPLDEEGNVRPTTIKGTNGHHPIQESSEDDSASNIPEGRKESVPPMLAPLAPGGAGWMEDYNALDELFAPGKGQNGVDLRTDLNEVQIIQFARARAISEHYNIPQLDNFVNNIARLSISKGRKSRTEFVNAFRSAAMGDSAEAMSLAGGIMGKLKS